MTGRTRAGTFLLCALIASAAGACGSRNDHPPDQLLKDSLGLTDSDRVLRVELAASDNRERPSPAEVVIPPGAFVEFVTTDRRLHTVRFLLEDMEPGPSGFLDGGGQDASPPLLEMGSRFVVSFREAPPGRYPYVVEGNGEEGRGVVVVQAEGG